jgi:hypothetical protein
MQHHIYLTAYAIRVTPDDELLKIALASQLTKIIKLVLHNQILHNGQFAFG